MRAGRLRTRIQVQREVIVRGAHNQTRSEWVTFATVYGEVRSATGREAVAGGSLRADCDCAVTCRFFAAAIAPTDRLKIDSRILNITAAYDPDGRRRELVILAIEPRAPERT